MSDTLTTVEKVEAIYDAVEDIKDAVAAKGVTVPEPCPIASIADLIDSIETGGEQPQLHAPSISRSNDTITISNPSTNGSYASAFKILNGDTQLSSQSGTTLSLIGLGAGTYELTVRATGTNFVDSDKSNKIKASVYTITKTLENLSISNNATLISSGLPYTATLTPASGYYLPEEITVTMGGNPAKFEYNSYTGAISIAAVTGNIVITAAAYNAPKLRKPKLSMSGASLTVEPPLYAEQTVVYIDGEPEYTINAE